MNNAFIEALKRLTNDQLIYALIGAWGAFVLIVLYFRLPSIIRAILKRSRQIESNQEVLIANQKIIASILLEIAMKLKLQISSTPLQNIEKYDDEETL